MKRIQKHNTMKTTRLYTLFVLLMLFVVSCNKPDEPNNGGNNNDVRVTTYTPQDITAITAKCGGDVIVTQGLSLTELGVCWSVEQNPTADKQHLSTTAWNEPFVCTIANLEPDTKYYVRAFALRGLEYYYGDEKNFVTPKDHEYIDLGLPSGTLWATCNVGANSPEGCGDYFAWGETKPKSVYDWTTYQYCFDNDQLKLIKYCSNMSCGYNGYTDTLTILLPEDDAATANWGDGWCMPTENQCRELIDNTNHVWTTNNGMNGLLFTANNGNCLFLPAAEDGINSFNGVGVFGSYWSSSLANYPNFNHPNLARSISFSHGSCGLSVPGRCVGCSVRPVRSMK